MKVTIVNCFDTYEHRVDLLHKYFKDKGYDVNIIQSDFRHFQKIKRQDKKENFNFVDTLPYYKNMSISRMKSHYNFAKKAFKIVEDIKPDILYVLIPANSLAKFAGKYKEKNKNIRLYFDIIDLWPETMPIRKAKILPPFILWKLLRDGYLDKADYVITECNLYMKVLKDKLKNKKAKTIYLARENKKINSNPKLDEDKINLCYLGSINNIIDIKIIKKLIKEINLIKPTTLHVIGDGEKKDDLINEIKSIGAKVEYYGRVYDSERKQKIFDECHFGLNIMKNTVCVGLTMKSIDYFEAGLPILNNIKGDTKSLVDKFGIGFNIDISKINDISKTIANYDIRSILEMRNKTRRKFEELFTIENFNKCINEIVEFKE